MLNDKTETGNPLMIDLVNDFYLSALSSFRHIICYSNVKHDPAVHYSTSAIMNRRFETKFDLSNLALPAIIPDDFPDNTVRHDIIDESNYEIRMLSKLNRINWNRFAVIPARPLLAHVDIIIKSEYWNEQHGYPVVAHMLENFQHTFTKPTLYRALSLNPGREHLVVLVPGHDSISHDLLPLADALRNRYPKPKYRIVVPCCNDLKTSDGIANGSARLFQWLHDIITTSPINRISFIGESVGGLYARTLIGMLYNANIIPNLVEPCTFITIATQHLGVRKITNQKLTSKYLSPLMSETGQQLNFLDRDQHLLMLASEKFVKPLALFKNLVLYCPYKQEPLGYFSTWAITSIDHPKIKIRQNQTRILKLSMNEPLDIKESLEKDIIHSLAPLPWKRYCIASSSSMKRQSYWTYTKNHPLVSHLLQEIQL